MKKIAIYLVAGTLVGNVFYQDVVSKRMLITLRKGAVIGAVNWWRCFRCVFW